MEQLFTGYGCGWPKLTAGFPNAADDECKTFDEIMAAEEAALHKGRQHDDAAARKTLPPAEPPRASSDTAEQQTPLASSGGVHRQNDDEAKEEEEDTSQLVAPKPSDDVLLHRRESEASSYLGELRVAELAEEIATLNEDATQLDTELLQVQKEMLETMRSQLRVERHKNRVLTERLDKLQPQRSISTEDEEYTTPDEATRNMLRAVYDEYAGTHGLSRQRFARLCDEISLGQSRRSVDLAFYEARQWRSHHHMMSSSPSEHKRHSLDFALFLEALDKLLARDDCRRSGRLANLHAFLGTPESARLRARAAAVLLDQPALLVKCGPHMLRAACETVAASIAAECELLAHPTVLAVVDAHYLDLDCLFQEAARAQSYPNANELSLAACAAILADCWIVPALVSYASAVRLTAILVARDSARDESHFKTQLLPELLLQKHADQRYSLSFLLFVELLGHLALRVMAGRNPQARLAAMFEWLHRSTKPDFNKHRSRPLFAPSNLTQSHCRLRVGADSS